MVGLCPDKTSVGLEAIGGVQGGLAETALMAGKVNGGMHDCTLLIRTEKDLCTAPQMYAEPFHSGCGFLQLLLVTSLCVLQANGTRGACASR